MKGRNLAIFIAVIVLAVTTHSLRAEELKAGVLRKSAVALHDANTKLVWKKSLAPGDYTFVISMFAPSPKADAIYTVVNGHRVRHVASAWKKWITVERRIAVDRPTEILLDVSLDPRESELWVDRMMVVRGPSGSQKGAEYKLMLIREKVTPHKLSRFNLKSLPQKPAGRGLDTLLYCSFDKNPEAEYARGVAGSHILRGVGMVPGKWGQALGSTKKDATTYYNAAGNVNPLRGTIECWVKSGEPNIWADGKEHSILGLIPRIAMPDSPRLAMKFLVFKDKANRLVFKVANCLRAPLSLAVPVGKLSATDWHHLAVSWDCHDGKIALWLSVDGNGTKLEQKCVGTPVPFVALRLGNKEGSRYPRNAEVPFGGLIDDLHVSDVSLAGREQGANVLDIGPIDEKLAMAAEDGLRRWLHGWAKLQLGGAWGRRRSAPFYFPSMLFGEAGGNDPRPADPRCVLMVYGSSGVAAFLFLEAYEVMGNEQYLTVAEKTAEFFLRAQHKRGFWSMGYLVHESGRVIPTSGYQAKSPDIAAMKGFRQRGPFDFLVYMYRVTGKERYLNAARRCADFLLEIQYPNGTFPGMYDCRTGIGKSSVEGVVNGSAYNDYVTTDPLRMLITMYHVTGDEKYIKGAHGKGIAGIGQWMFDTQLGKGKVRGWCQQYGKDNKPAWARRFEAPVIDTRVVDRFVGPMCLWFHLMTGDERYHNLMKETYAWYKSIEIPGPKGGWFGQYLADGTVVYSTKFKTFKIEPNDPRHKPRRRKFNFRELGKWLKERQELGKEKFRRTYAGKMNFTTKEIAAIRLDAANTARSLAASKRLRDTIKHQHRSGYWIRGGTRRHVRTYPYPQYRAQELMEFVRAVRTARGKMPVSALPKGGIGLYDELTTRSSSWWGRRLIWFTEDWFDVPLEEEK